MEDNKIRDGFSKFFPKISFGLIVVAIFYIVLTCKNEMTRFDNNDKIVSHDTVSIETFGEVKVPYNIVAKKGKTYIVHDVIPKEITDNYAMMLYSNYSRQKVYVGGNLIGSYGVRKPMMGTDLIGNIRVVIPIDKSMAGEEVTIVLVSYYDQNMDYNSPIYGNRDALIRAVLKHNMGRITMLIMLFTLCIISFTIAIYIKKFVSSLNYRIMIYYSFFVIFIMVWIFCSSDLPQFITNANVLVSFISFISLAMAGVAYNGFCEQTFTEDSKKFTILMLAGWTIPLINIVAFLMGASDPMILLPLTHLHFVATALVSTVVSIKYWQKNSSNMIFSISVLIMIITAIVGLVLNYLMPTTGRAGFAIGVGMLMFSYGLMAMIIHKIAHMVESDKDIRNFRELAYEDVMTGLANRSSFEKFFDDIGDMEIEGKTVTLFMFDLNFLKKVNDQYGHKAGDQMLIGLAKCIEKTYRKYGTAYRLGGDEFASIVIGHADQILNIVEEFKKTVEEYNKYNEHSISTAIGYATRKFHRGDPDFYSRLFREADDVMYSNKVRMHEEMGEEVRNIKND